MVSRNIQKPLIGVVVGLDREKKLINKNKNLIIESGYGIKAIEATKKLLKRNVDVILSFGLAGSIDKSIKNSDILIPKIIFHKNKKGLKTSKKLNIYFKRILNDFKFFDNNLLTSSNIENLSELKTKPSIEGKNISAVDMESYFINDLAQKNKVEFCAIRVIFDDLDFSIPLFIHRMIDQNGEIIIKNLLIELVLKPKRALQLIKLMKYYIRSKKVLEDIGQKLN